MKAIKRTFRQRKLGIQKHHRFILEHCLINYTQRVTKLYVRCRYSQVITPPGASDLPPIIKYFIYYRNPAIF